MRTCPSSSNNNRLSCSALICAVLFPLHRFTRQPPLSKLHMDLFFTWRRQSRVVLWSMRMYTLDFCIPRSLLALVALEMEKRTWCTVDGWSDVWRKHWTSAGYNSAGDSVAYVYNHVLRRSITKRDSQDASMLRSIDTKSADPSNGVFFTCSPQRHLHFHYPSTSLETPQSLVLCLSQALSSGLVIDKDVDPRSMYPSLCVWLCCPTHRKRERLVNSPRPKHRF